MSVNNTKKTQNQYIEKTGKRPKFKRGNPGRPKGAKDKFYRSAKQNIEKVVEELGGWEGILEWARNNQRNRGLLYGWYFRMLPSNLDVEHSGELKVPIKLIIENNNANGNNKES